MKITPEKLSQQLFALKDSLDQNLSIADMRAQMQVQGAELPIAKGVTISANSIEQVPALRFKPEEARSARLLLYFHGGGYAIGSAETHQGFTSQLAASLKYEALSLDYRLAPEAPFPAALQDVTSVYTHLLESGMLSSDIVLAGDSAGGGLCLSLALKLKEMGIPQPGGIILMSPWTDLTLSGASYDELDDLDPVTDQDSINMMKEAYLDGERPQNPLVSPVYGNLAGLPPILIQVGSWEALLSDSLILAENAAMMGVDVTLEVWPKMVHVFQAYYALLDESVQAIDRMAEWERLKVAKQ
jgi:acetyl esterase/lipase